MATEKIRLEIVFAPPKVIEFQGSVIEHYRPPKLNFMSPDGIASTAEQAGEFLRVAGMPQDFDYDAGWNVITCSTLGDDPRYLSQPIIREKDGRAHFQLKVV